MNERIRELSDIAYKNYLAKNPHSSYGRRLDYDREFAELILGECCEVINAAKPGVNQVPAEVALDMTAKNIKAYFGVEE